MRMVLLLGFWLVHASAIVSTAAASAIPVGEVTAATTKSQTNRRMDLLRDGPYMTTTTTRKLVHQLQHQCVATTDFPKCHAPIQPAERQRLRREVRSLPSTEWDKVVRAMWTMKNISSMAAGKAQYGPGFRPYDYFVAKHAVATTDARGDQAHYGAHFITWHAAFVLEFENALLTVDPTILALPYWDATTRQPSVFTAQYFGLDPTTADQGVVTTGRFANWPVNVNYSLTDYLGNVNTTNSTITYNGSRASPRILRGDDNPETSPFVVRLGRGSLWESIAPTTDVFWGCATGAAIQTWTDWSICIEQKLPSLHFGPHGTIGGRGSNFRPGDFTDQVSSPNDPIFMFHHANLDRNHMWWVVRQQQQQQQLNTSASNTSSSSPVCQYYGFPVSNASFIGVAPGATANGSFYGAHLNDIVSSTWGFTKSDLGFPLAVTNDTKTNQTTMATGSNSTSNNDRALVTHADLVCWMGPDTAMYTYDTNRACLVDPTKCHPVQRLVNNSIDNDDGSTTILPDMMRRILTVLSTMVDVIASFLQTWRGYARKDAAEAAQSGGTT
jgi:hypothetical protein